MKDNHIKKNTVQFEKIRSGVSEFFDEKRQLPRLIKTGFNTLDEMLGGGLASGLNVLGAKPGSGKTSLVLQMAEHFSSRGVPVLYFSLEMSLLTICKSSAATRNTRPKGRTLTR
ncbi:DnaB-like helicase C-terminal domain-containing protein [Ruminococcus sp.]|uniref:DnaB-like helicase C-terminal domain-containing protein n=1 Tax=Ruminococcus sp. TaxID=41978 RepID=UPI00387076DE